MSLSYQEVANLQQNANIIIKWNFIFNEITKSKNLDSYIRFPRGMTWRQLGSLSSAPRKTPSIGPEVTAELEYTELGTPESRVRPLTWSFLSEILMELVIVISFSFPSFSSLSSLGSFGFSNTPNFYKHRVII